MTSRQQLSTRQLTLLTTGSMLGTGWLFAPFYGFQMAGIWVILAWIITAFFTFIIALSFAEISSILPIVGGISRYLRVTHNRTFSFIFLIRSWVGVVVFLALETEAAIQYLSFWWKGLIVHSGNQIALSMLGVITCGIILLSLTGLNCLLITRVTKINSFTGFWKIVIPIGIALFIIIFFGKFDNVVQNYHRTKFSLQTILVAITGSGIAFAFTGFSNGLVMAQETSDTKRSLPYSLFSALIYGTAIYIMLSMVFIFCLSDPQKILNLSIAPLLGVVALLGINFIYIILFADAILAPLATTNVCIALGSRELYAISLDFLPNSILTKLNLYKAPYICLCLNGFLALCCLAPSPTWKTLVSFLSSVSIIAYISGPVSLIILRKEFPELKRSFKLVFPKLIAYTGFSFCSLMIYWSSLHNLILLSVALTFIVAGLAIISRNFYRVLKDANPLLIYVFSITLVSFLHTHRYVSFPFDNLIIVGSSIINCWLFSNLHLNHDSIRNNLKQLNLLENKI